PLRASTATIELVTPTGAALLAALARFEQPAIQVDRIGYGFGQKTLPWPNVIRLWIGEGQEATADGGLETDQIVVIEANLDDDTPEIVGATLEALMRAGAFD